MNTVSIDNITARVYYKPLPAAAHGCCAKESDSEYIILINSDLSPEDQAEALEHELIHIRRDDFNMTDLSVDQTELSTHEEARQRKEA